MARPRRREGGPFGVRSTGLTASEVQENTQAVLNGLKSGGADRSHMPLQAVMADGPNGLAQHQAGPRQAPFRRRDRDARRERAEVSRDRQDKRKFKRPLVEPIRRDDEHGPAARLLVSHGRIEIPKPYVAIVTTPRG